MSDPLVNVEAEAEFLGSLMANNPDVDRVSDIVRPDDIFDPAHRRIFEAILRETAQGMQLAGHPRCRYPLKFGT